MSIAVLIEAAEFLERRERGTKRIFICIYFFPSPASGAKPPEKKVWKTIWGSMAPRYFLSHPFPSETPSWKKIEKGEKSEKKK